MNRLLGVCAASTGHLNVGATLHALPCNIACACNKVQYPVACQCSNLTGLCGRTLACQGVVRCAGFTVLCSPTTYVLPTLGMPLLTGAGGES